MFIRQINKGFNCQGRQNQMAKQNCSKLVDFFFSHLISMSVFIFLLTSAYPAFGADLFVKHRGVVNTELINKRTGHPHFAELKLKRSSLVKGMFYDQGNSYLLVRLGNSWYHYCGITQKEVRSWQNSQSLGSYYRSSIKGEYDCRTGFVPQY